MNFAEDRAARDQSRAISYLNAFNECQLVAELVKWVCNQAGIVDQNTIPDITDPGALISESLHLLYNLLVYFNLSFLSFILANFNIWSSPFHTKWKFSVSLRIIPDGN